MTGAAWLAKAEAFLKERKVPEPRANAEFLLAEVLGVGRASAVAQGDRELSERLSRHFWNWVKERGRRVPLAYIVGHQPFLDLRIAVTRDVLIPRPETEELVLECVRLLERAAAPRIFEIGTGSGAVAVALARRLPNAIVFATDVSPRALALAEKNAGAHHVAGRIRFVREDLFEARAVGASAGWADLLVSNPPYIPSADVDHLEPEVLAEPRLALDGGKDGLDAVRAVVAAAPRRLKAGGCIALEIGAAQGPRVAGLLEKAGFSEVQVRRDAQGLDRIAVGKMIN